MYCKNCGKELPDTAVICSACGTMQKQPEQSSPYGDMNAPAQADFDNNAAQPNVQPSFASYAEPNMQGYAMPPNVQAQKKNKKTFIIVFSVVGAAVIILGIVLAVIFSSKNTTNDNSDTAAGVTAEAAAPENTKAAASADTTISDFYAEFATEDRLDFTLSEESIEALNSNAWFFPCADENMAKLQAAAVTHTYNELTKSIGKYDNQFIRLSNAEVVDITESTDEIYTYVHFFDSDFNSYVGIIIGTLPSIYDGDIVEVYALPLDVIYFDNQGGTTTEAVMLAVCSCKKPSETVDAAQNTTVRTDDIEYILSTNPKEYFLSVNVGTPNSDDVPAPWEYWVCTETLDVLNMRSSWSMDAPVVTKLAWGTDLLVYGFYNGWAYAETLDGKYAGWCKAEYLESSSIL